MAVRSSMIETLIKALPNPTLLSIGNFQLKSLHIALVALVLLTYFAVKKLNNITASRGDGSNPAGAIAVIFIPIALVLIILITAFGKHN